MNELQLFWGVVATTCNLATLETEFRKRKCLIPVGSDSPSIGRWLVWPSDHKERNMTKK